MCLNFSKCLSSPIILSAFFVLCSVGVRHFAPGDPQSSVHWQHSEGLLLRQRGVHGVCRVQIRLRVGGCLLVVVPVHLLPV